MLWLCFYFAVSPSLCKADQAWTVCVCPWSTLCRWAAYGLVLNRQMWFACFHLCWSLTPKCSQSPWSDQLHPRASYPWHTGWSLQSLWSEDSRGVIWYCERARRNSGPGVQITHNNSYVQCIITAFRGPHHNNSDNTINKPILTPALN